MLRVVKAAVSSYEINKDSWGMSEGKVKTVILHQKLHSSESVFRFQMIEYALDATKERRGRLEFMLFHA